MLRTHGMRLRMCPNPIYTRRFFRVILKSLVSAVVILLVGILSPVAVAGSISFSLGSVFSSGTVGVYPDGTLPWLVMTFDDHGSTGSVALTIESKLQNGSEYIDSAYFNFEGDARTLSFSEPDVSGGDGFAGATIDEQ